MQQFLDYYFWFAQPSTILDRYDMAFAYLFAAITFIGLVLSIVARLLKHPVYGKIFRKLGHLAVTIGFSGLIWFGLRYENTPIFANRYWAGLTLLIGLVWLGFILKYLLFRFRKEKKEYEKAEINKRYISGRS